MNMSLTSSKQINQNLNGFIGEDIVAVSAKDSVKQAEKMHNAKQFLDNKFPLDSGSHQDVCSYVVYYQHLLAFFKDGSQSGLRQPCQFVALSGHKSEPTAILLQDQGVHVEVNFDRSSQMGCEDCAHIDDIQIEAPLVAIVTEQQAPSGQTQAQRYWMSLLNSNNQTGTRQQEDKLFTAKDGTEYILNGQVTR